MMKTQAQAIITLCITLLLWGCSSTDKPSIPLAKVDMEQMWGGWYLIATMPNFFERGMVEPYDVYSKRPDGDIQEDFFVKNNTFASEQKHYTVHDWVRPDTNNAHWRVQIFWPIDLPFLVLYTDPHYRYVLYGEESRDLGWIYSRTQTIPDADYEFLLKQFASLGYDTSKFLKFVQLPEQIGQPGYWSEKIH